jgi:DNA-binding IclR family transcriptional regulator
MKALPLSDAPQPAGLPPQRAGIQSLEVGFALQQVLAEAHGPLMLRDLAAKADVSAAKAHRYLVSYQRLGLVVQDAGSTRYDLGPAALKLGLASLSRPDSVKLDADGHLVLGMVALGSFATFDPTWDGGVATPLRAAAARLSAELGFVAA